MRDRLLRFLHCPACGGELNASVSHAEAAPFEERLLRELYQDLYASGPSDAPSWAGFCQEFNREIITGTLSCGRCESEYPIERGVPRMLPQELRTESGLGRGRPITDARLRTFRDGADPITLEGDQGSFHEVQLANQSNYGYEWQTFAHEYEGWEAVYDNYYVFEPAEYFRGKVGLDAGCGMGRYSAVAARRGAEVVGVDLSNAVDAAYRKSLRIPNYHVVQGDIYRLPVKVESFDFAQTLGVIHIAPDPEAALTAILRAVRPGGKIFIYVYPDFSDENRLKYHLLKTVTLVRRFTVKLPSNVLYYLLYSVVPVVAVTCYVPSWILGRLPGLKKFANLLPYSEEQYGARKWRDIHLNLFDRFGNPVERRYSRSEITAWMDRMDFSSYRLRFRDGWTVAGEK